MPNPNNQPLPLYRVLIEEYRAQRPEEFRTRTPEEESDAAQFDAMFEARLKELSLAYGLADEKGYALDLDGDARARIEKKINSEMVKEFYSWLHRGEREGRRPRSALCLSGGGIRSATFGLGVLQGLARRGLLEHFDYLSTVSGGGYLGGWFSAWVHRRGLKGVVARLKNQPKRKSPLQPEPEAVKHLRTYSNYMSPKVGVLSADTWTLVAIYLRNLILNWLVLVPLILAALVLPRIFTWQVAVAQKDWSRSWAEAHGAGVFLFGVFAGIVAVAYIYISRPSLSLRIPVRLRTQKWFLWLCVLPFFVLSLCSTLAYAWFPAIPVPAWTPDWLRYEDDGTGLWRVFVFFGVALHAGGFLVALPVMHWRKNSAVPRSSLLREYAKEFVVALFGGALSGFLTWAVATNFFPHLPTRVGLAFSVAQTAAYACFALPVFLLMVLIAVTIFIGIMSRVLKDEDREWLARAGGWVLIVGFGWILASVIVIFSPVLLANLGATARTALASTGVISGLVTLVFGRSPKSPANKKEGESSATVSAVSNLALSLAAAVFTVFILTIISLLTGWIVRELVAHLRPISAAPHENTLLWHLAELLVPHPAPWYGTSYASFDQYGLLNLLYFTPVRILVALFLVSLAVSFAMGLTVNINKFSLHGAYRDRLVRAYLGASRNERERRPNPFTGMDEQDNIQMQELRTERFYADALRLDVLAPQLRGGGASDASQFIYSLLPEGTRALVDNYGLSPGDEPPDDPRDRQIRTTVADDLNRIIEEPERRLYQEAAFADCLTADREHAEEIKRLVPRPHEHIDVVGVERLRANRRIMELAFPGAFREARMCKPLHVVNISLNLVGGEDLAWQNRKAESFTISPLHSGSFCLGYRDSRAYALDASKRAISLGTAVAVSGAAVSPNMGYHSSPLVTFLLTLFNVRLGWWLGNPGEAGATTFNRPGPLLAFRPIIAEALGLTNDRNKYVYLSDGGHFENLGLYEMIVRRCRYIVVSDGSEDAGYTFEGLGNAISKVRVDLGVPIHFDKIFIFPKDYQTDDEIEKRLRGYCALGRVNYSCVDGGEPEEVDGYVLYIKATLTGSEPRDIYNYSRAHDAFPHESTGDQMYSEEQFESYRELGSHAFSEICRNLGGGVCDDEPTDGARAPQADAIAEFFQVISEQFESQLGGGDDGGGDGRGDAAPPPCL
ncbi:MAG TPA: patatin-like phospholipase family protein [Pyrinomonadaceae bacterium]|jgi:hypothetical protein